MQPGVPCGMGLSWYLPSPWHFGQRVTSPRTTPVPEQPAQTVQKMQPALCGMVLRWTLPLPPHWKQACGPAAAGAAGAGAGAGAAPDRAPQLEQKWLVLAICAPQDEQNMRRLPGYEGERARDPAPARPFDHQATALSSLRRPDSSHAADRPRRVVLLGA